MKRKLTALSRRYVTALRKRLRQGPRASLQPAHDLGRQAAALDLETLDVARIHEAALATLEASSSRDGLIKRVEIFFTEAITPIEKTHRSAREATVHLKKIVETLSQRTVELAASNLELSLKITQRKAVEEALTYVARPAQTSREDVSIQKLPRVICLKIKDNGKSFQAQRVMDSKRNPRLGLIGMRERLEMGGGSFAVESAPGKGTTIRAQIPFMNDNRV